MYEGRSILAISRETGIGRAIMYHWRRTGRFEEFVKTGLRPSRAGYDSKYRRRYGLTLRALSEASGLTHHQLRRLLDQGRFEEFVKGFLAAQKNSLDASGVQAVG